MSRVTLVSGVALALALTLALLAACDSSSGARTQVMVVIDAQSQVRSKTADVDVEVRTGTGPVAGWEKRRLQSITPGDGVSWPLELGLVPKGGDADRVFLVIATARDEAGEAIAQVRAIGGYQRGKTLSLLLLFEDSCIDKAELCDEQQTCRRGACVDAHVASGDLPDYARDDAGAPVLIPFWDDAGAVGEGGSGGRGGGGSGGTGGSGGSDAGVNDAGPDGGPGSSGGECADDGDCDDGDPCNGKEQCADDVCKAGKAFKCPDVDQPCLKNVCVNDHGDPSCETRNADEGDTCQDGDESDDAETSCSRDYVCVEGACEPQTVEDCDPGQCRTPEGCDPDDGCVYDPKSDTTDCDDDEACTQNDKCDGDGSCEGEAFSCDDAVACTVDVCDGAGGCTHDPSDALCSGPCKSGTCDATMNCLNVTFSQDFTDCEDGNATTDDDMCYRGECLGGSQGAPTASCQVGGCGCSGFGTIRDLEYSPTGPSYVGLIDAQQTGVAPCTSGTTVSIVYDVTPDALTAYTTDTLNGAISEAGADINTTNVVSSAHVGTLDVAAKSVDWLDTTYDTLIAGKTIANLRGMTRHSEGSLFADRWFHAWIWGVDSGTTSSSRVIHCTSCSSTVVIGGGGGGGGCNVPLSCGDATGYVTSSIAAIVPYTYSSGLLNTAYGGVMQVVNLPSGTARRRIYEDGVSKDYLATGLRIEENDGVWGGALRTSTTGEVLVHGSGSNNLRLCTDDDNNGSVTSCVAITGLPNQSVRNYTRSVMGYTSTAMFMLANTGASYYLVMLPAGLSPLDGDNWTEILLASSGTSANAVAVGPSSIRVLGKAGSAPYVWSWDL